MSDDLLNSFLGEFFAQPQHADLKWRLWPNNERKAWICDLNTTTHKVSVMWSFSELENSGTINEKNLQHAVLVLRCAAANMEQSLP